MEKLVYHAKHLSLIPCLAGLLGFLVMLILGTFNLLKACYFLIPAWQSNFSYESSKALIALAVFALDQYLISFVFLIFSAGLYSLFLSTNTNYLKHIPALRIQSLDELKETLAKAVILALIVEFFKFAIEMEYYSSLDLLYLSCSILSMGGVFFLVFHKWGGGK